MAKGVAQRLVNMLTGREPDSLGIAQGVHTTIGFAALTDIQEDFLRKARGGVGEDGVKWKPLSPKTLAYSRRFGPGEQARLKRGAGLGPHHRHGPGDSKGLLTKEQLTRWRKIYGGVLNRLLASMPEKAAKARAAQIAWAKLKAEGAKTKLEVFGNRPHEILRDTSILLNSLSPGQLGGGDGNLSYRPPSGDGGDQQVFQTLANGVIVGTTVPYAEAHQNGDPARNLPARPFLPVGQVPDAWEQRWLDAANQALAIGAQRLFEAA